MRLTPRGKGAAALATCLGVLALVVGSTSAALGAFALASALAFSIATAPAPRVRLERRVERTRLTEGEEFEEELELQLVRGRAWVSIDEASTAGLTRQGGPVDLLLEATRPTSIKLRWRADAWGRNRIGPTSLRALDALHLIEVITEVTTSLEVRIMPRAQKLGKFAPRANAPQPALGLHSVSRPGDGSEFFSLREYQAGDSIRRINWKASARSKNMIVNQATRDTFARVLVILDLRAKEEWGERGDGARVRSGRVVASLLHHHERRRDHLTLVCVTHEAKRLSLAANPRVDDLLHELAGLEAAGSVDMSDIVEHNLRLFRPRSPVYLVTSAAMDLDLVPAIQTILPFECKLIVISPAVGQDPDDPESSRIARASRRRALRGVRALGVRVVDWARDQPLEVALTEA